MPTRQCLGLLGPVLSALSFVALACAETIHMEHPPAAYKRVSVTDFGAVPDDGKDDTVAVAKAVQACINQPGTALIFPKGRYDFFSKNRIGRTRYQISFVGARKLAVDGQGSRFIFHGKTAPFWVKDCHDITFMNFTIDWDDPVFSSGIITRADDRSFEIALKRQYTGEGSEKIESIIEFDAETHVPKRGGRDVHDLPRASNPTIGSYQKIDENTLRVTLRRKRRMSVGALAIIRHQVYVYNGFSVRDCKRLTLKDVTIHFAPGMGISCSRSEDILLKRVRMAPPPGSDRVLSISSDGTHFSECGGTIRIEDCYFQGMGDDATNIHGYYYDVVAVVDDRTLEAKCKDTWIVPIDPGNVMEFTDPATLLPFGTGKVKSCKVDRRTKIHRISFESPIPEATKAGIYLANATRTAKVHISGNTVKANRARGFVIKTRNAVIEDNTFDSVSGAGVFVAVEGDHWREAIGTRNVVVRNNVFKDCNGGPSRRWAVISVFALTGGPSGSRQGQAGVHQNLLLENNRILGTDNAGIFISSADGVVVRNNTISDCSRRPSRGEGKNAIFLMNCRNVTVQGNTLKEPGEGLDKPLGLGKGVEKSTLKIEGNAGF